VPIRSRPTPIVQRRSKPVNGRVPALALLAEVLAGVPLLVSASVEDAGVPFSFDGDVPADGVGDVCSEPVVVGVVPVVVVVLVGVVPEVGVVPVVVVVGVVPDVDVVGGGGVWL
jgi:hypothetical protein